MIDPLAHQQYKVKDLDTRMDTMGQSTDSRTAAVNETKDATAPLDQVRHELLRIAALQPDAMGVLHRHNFVFNRFPRDMEKEPPLNEEERWEALAFTFYSSIVGADSMAQTALEALDEATSGDGLTTGADSAGSGAPRTVNAEARDPHSSAASSAAPLPSACPHRHVHTWTNRSGFGDWTPDVGMRCDCGATGWHTGADHPLPSEIDLQEEVAGLRLAFEEERAENFRNVQRAEKAEAALAAADLALSERHDIDPAEGRVVSVFSDGSYLLDTPAGTRKHYFFNADPVLRTLSRQWRAKATQLRKARDDHDSDRMKDILHNESVIWDSCAADLDRVCPPRQRKVDLETRNQQTLQSFLERAELAEAEVVRLKVMVERLNALPLDGEAERAERG